MREIVTCCAMSSTARSLRARLIETVGVASLFAVLVAIVTWPQITVWATHAHVHHDVLFSMWRLSWIHEALTTGQPLFDAPIFHPVPKTFAFSDAVLLQGLTALPALMLGADVLPVYNVLLLGSMWASGLGAFLLVRSLLDREREASAVRVWAPVVAGVIFALLPYRIEHFFHLELQWSQWMPLACWALHRTVRAGRVRDGVLTAVFVLAQFLSGIYYGIFLVVVLAMAAPVLVVTRERASLGAIARALAVGAVICAGPLAWYGAPYRANQEALGGRSGDEIDTWSATPASFLSAPPENRLYGTLTADLGRSEGRLLPGVLATALAIAGFWWRRRTRETWMYATMLVVSAVMALGTNTVVYRLVLAAVPPLRGLRAPARFGMVLALALAVLAGFGAAVLLSRMRKRTWRHVAGVLLTSVLVAEYASAIGPLEPWVQRAPTYAAWLKQQPPGVVLDLPMPRPWALPLHEAEWAYLASFHDKPLINGYSGYFPRPYFEVLEKMLVFHRESTIDFLRSRGVRYIVVHKDRYEDADFIALDEEMRQRRGVRAAGYFPDMKYPASIYTIEP